MSMINVVGAIEFRFSVTDFDLAMKIQQLLKQHPHGILKPAAAKQGGNGHGGRTRGRAQEKQAKILKLLKDKYGTKVFHAGEAAADVAHLGCGYDTTRRALKAAKAEGNLVSEKKGIYHFLELVSTQPPAAGPGASSAATPLPASA